MHIDYGVYIRTDLYAHMLWRVESNTDGLSCIHIDCDVCIRIEIHAHRLWCGKHTDFGVRQRSEMHARPPWCVDWWRVLEPDPEAHNDTISCGDGLRCIHIRCGVSIWIVVHAQSPWRVESSRDGLRCMHIDCGEFKRIRMHAHTVWRIEMD